MAPSEADSFPVAIRNVFRVEQPGAQGICIFKLRRGAPLSYCLRKGRAAWEFSLRAETRPVSNTPV